MTSRNKNHLIAPTKRALLFFPLLAATKRTLFDFLQKDRKTFDIVETWHFQGLGVFVKLFKIILLVRERHCHYCVILSCLYLLFPCLLKIGMELKIEINQYCSKKFECLCLRFIVTPFMRYRSFSDLSTISQHDTFLATPQYIIRIQSTVRAYDSYSLLD